MLQWTNLQRIGKFTNPIQLYITCEKSGGLPLAELSLTAGRQSVRPADKIWVRLEILKAFNFPLCLDKVLFYFSNFDALQMLFSSKYCYKVVL